MVGIPQRNHYRDFELKRDQMMDTARRQHLMREALENSPQTPSAINQAFQRLHDAIMKTDEHKPHVRLKARKVFLLTLIMVVLLFAGVAPMFAHGDITLDDPGATEPYHPALVQFRVGYYYQLQGDHERALIEFNEVVAALDEWSSGYSARGDSYAALEQYELAIADYDTALELDPAFVSVMYMRGRAFEALGDQTAALEDFETAVELMPEFALPYLGIGDLFYEQGELTTALTNYRQYQTLTEDEIAPELLARISELETVAVAQIG